MLGNVEDIVYEQARQGTAVNPGLPDNLALYLVAMACHETGDFDSNIFRDDKNAFGYSYVAGSRYQEGPGRMADNGQYAAHYRTVNDSVRELVDWIYRRRAEGIFPANLRAITSLAQYVSLLKRSSYFQDTEQNYLRGAQRCFESLVLTRLPDPAIPLILSGLFLAAGVALSKGNIGFGSRRGLLFS